MELFTQDILNRQVELKKGNFNNIKAEISKQFWLSLPYDYKNRHEYLNDFNIAFLDLYQEHESILLQSYTAVLQESLYEYYKNAEEDQFRSLTVEDDLSIHSIDFPKYKDEIEWKINYEMELDHTIFHVYFEGWKFKTIGHTP